jgi:hypothetical protein
MIIFTYLRKILGDLKMHDFTQIPLRDIHLPDPISWWPLAIGWWILLGLCSLLLFVTFIMIRRALKPTLKKEVNGKLNQIELVFQKNENASECLAEISILLRRVLFSRDQKLAGVTGEAWLVVLDRPLDRPEFSQGAGRILLTGPYQEKVDSEAVSQLIELCKRWVQRL